MADEPTGRPWPPPGTHCGAGSSPRRGPRDRVVELPEPSGEHEHRSDLDRHDHDARLRPHRHRRRSPPPDPVDRHRHSVALGRARTRCWRAHPPGRPPPRPARAVREAGRSAAPIEGWRRPPRGPDLLRPAGHHRVLRRARGVPPRRAVREPRLLRLHPLLLRHRQPQHAGVLRLPRPRPQTRAGGARRRPAPRHLGDARALRGGQATTRRRRASPTSDPIVASRSRSTSRTPTASRSS